MNPIDPHATSDTGEPAANGEPAQRPATPAAPQPGPRRPVIDDAPLIPDRSADDSDTGWGDGSDSNDDRLRRDVPPHW